MLYNFIYRWPLLVFFATSGIAGVVYGFISEEWPLTLLSVGLTGKILKLSSSLDFKENIFDSVNICIY